MKSSKLVAIIPSLSPARIENLYELIDGLQAAHISSTVVANGRSLRDALASTTIAHISPAKNMGFGAAVNYAVHSLPDWDWLLVVNDDIRLRTGEFQLAVAKYLAPTSERKVVYFDEGAPRELPSLGGVFRSLSLIDGVVRKLQRRNGSRIDAANTYRSFSFIAISKEAWTAVDGFDERFLFTYEDADFVRRGIDANVTFQAAIKSGVVHEHSVTGRKHVDSVLPVSAWCGFQYLMKWGTPAPIAAISCAFALVVRLPLITLVSGSRSKHFRGTLRAILAVTRNRRPHLPAFESV
jgi:GT2 family glycosyltransferase